MPSNVLPLHLKQTFPPMIWIFTEGDGIESRLPFKIFSTLIIDLFIFQECRDVVMIGEHTDRVYTNTPPEHIITNVVSGRKMRVQKYNFPDTVIWNPWVDKAKEIPDFGNYF